MTQDIDIKSNDRFAVMAESTDYDRPLVLIDIPFARVIDEIVVPYDSGDSFFIDGVSLSRTDIKRIKIVNYKPGPHFRSEINKLSNGLTGSDPRKNKTYGDQYYVRLEHILRTQTIDVTSQVLKAYNQAVKPSLKEYLPKREDLIKAAMTVFCEAMKSLGG